MQIAPPFRHEKIADADVLAELASEAGEDMPLYLLAQMAEDGETAWNVGRRRSCERRAAFPF